MKTRIPLSALCLILLTTGPAQADGGTISFEGQIVESGCSLTAVAPAQAGQNIQPITANLALQVADENDACSRGYPAFTAEYAPLQSSDTDADGKVITLTYN